ncbi:MAG: ankyrin repeat domain-containing protein [Odoribacter splanchnicus]
MRAVTVRKALYRYSEKGGIDVNKRDAEGNTPLYYACLKGFGIL